MEWGADSESKELPWSCFLNWCLTCSLAEMSLLLSNFLVSSAFLGTPDLFLISVDIAKPVLPNTALRTFSDISLGAKIVSDSQELSITRRVAYGF